MNLKPLAILLAQAATTNAITLAIDSFDNTSQSIVTDNSGNHTVLGGFSAPIFNSVFTSRTLENRYSRNQTFNIESDRGVASFDKPAESRGAGYIDMTYSSDTAVNLRAGGGDKLLILFSSLVVERRAIFRVYLNGSNSSSINSFSHTFREDEENIKLEIPFSKFSRPANLTDVEDIKFSFSRWISGSSFTIDSISVVPEPSTAVFLLGSSCLFMRRRR